MAINTTITCDGCDKVKGTVNGWFLVFSRPAHLVPHFNIYVWNEDMYKEEGCLHVCGQSCLQQLLSRFLEKGQKREKTSGSVPVQYPDPTLDGPRY